MMKDIINLKCNQLYSYRNFHFYIFLEDDIYYAEEINFSIQRDRFLYSKNIIDLYIKAIDFIDFRLSLNDNISCQEWYKQETEFLINMYKGIGYGRYYKM